MSRLHQSQHSDYNLHLLSTIHASYESHLERVHECVGSSEEDEGYIDARQVSSNHDRDIEVCFNSYFRFSPVWSCVGWMP